MNKKIIFLLLLFSFFSIFLNLYKKNAVPPCFNADEAAFGYNAYSILKTGKDEYGTSLLLRLKSFGDYKMPLYSYLSIPFIGAFGLDEQNTRLLNTVLSFFFPILIFLLSKELFKKNNIALFSAFLTSFSPALHIISRQAHEAYLAMFLIIGATLFFIKSLKQNTLLNFFSFSVLLFLSLFTYQSSRVFAIFFFILLVLYKLFRNKIKTSFFVFLILVLFLSSIADIIYKPNRVKNLLFFNNLGFSLKINELRSEGGSRLFYNKAFIGLRDLTFEYLKYFSPQFLVEEGDQNPRFGFSGLSLLTPIEYLFVFIGLFFIFVRKEKWRYFFISLVLIAPVSSFLSWAGLSITRSLFLFIPLIIASAYGIVSSYYSTSNKIYKQAISILLFGFFIFFLFYSWDFYLNHYSKRALIVRSWQCGYKELVNYISKNYKKYDKFYITKRNGQPYIFLLFYLKYPPQKYQKQASLSNPDEYGFGQVQAFDKFTFDFTAQPKEKKYAIIGYPDDFLNVPKDQINLSKVKKKIKFGTEEVFWIYENP